MTPKPSAGRLTRAQTTLLEALVEHGPCRLTGIGSAIVAQGLIDKGFARPWAMGTVVITDAGRAALEASKNGSRPHEPD